MSRIEGEPFLIRGHHLSLYQEIIDGSLYPQAAAKVDRGVIAANKDPRYPPDVLGNDQQTADRVEERVAQTYQAFLDLPPEHPVKIVQVKDLLCDCCVVGTHCLKDDVKSEDDLYIDAFIGGVHSYRKNVSRSLHPNLIVNVEGSVRSLTTTVGVVRKILEHVDFENLAHLLDERDEAVASDPTLRGQPQEPQNSY